MVKGAVVVVSESDEFLTASSSCVRFELTRLNGRNYSFKPYRDRIRDGTTRNHYNRKSVRCLDQTAPKLNSDKPRFRVRKAYLQCVDRSRKPV